MGKTTTVYLLALLLVTLAVPLPVSGIDGWALGTGFHGALGITKSEAFSTKPQAAGGVSALMDVPLGALPSVGIAFQLHDTLASNLSEGFQYRGTGSQDGQHIPERLVLDNEDGLLELA